MHPGRSGGEAITCSVCIDQCCSHRSTKAKLNSTGPLSNVYLLFFLDSRPKPSTSVSPAPIKYSLQHSLCSKGGISELEGIAVDHCCVLGGSRSMSGGQRPAEWRRDAPTWWYPGRQGAASAHGGGLRPALLTVRTALER